MTFIVNPKFERYKSEVLTAFDQFSQTGENYMIGERNQIKLFKINSYTVNIKSFKIPNKLNQLVYKHFRKSKAKRSYEFALILLEKGIGTPQPIAYQETFGGLGLQRSFYASEHLNYDLTYRELVEIENYPDHENILRQFTQFCYKLHEEGVEFKDHSPGNTLIKKVSDDQYEFYLVDLNRMKFHNSMDIKLRMKNLSRLTPKKEMVRVMADEYAKISNQNSEDLFNLLWGFTSKFQFKFHRKQKIKKKLKSLF